MLSHLARGTAFHPETEIACGDVWTGQSTECHFWNVIGTGGDDTTWIDLSWQQFPPGSVVQKYRILDRNTLGDSPATVERCALLLRRVMACLRGEEPIADEQIQAVSRRAASPAARALPSDRD
jgi:hypothetical protein